MTGQHVVRVHRVPGQGQDRGRCLRPAILAADVGFEGHVGDGLADIEFDSPGLQQLVHRRAARHRPLQGVGRVAAVVGDGERIQKCHHLAPAQHELVNRILRPVRNLARVDDDQNLDVRFNSIHARRNFLHGEIPLQFVDENPRFLAALPHPHHHRVELAEDRQRAHHAHDRFLRSHDLRNQPRHVVFQHALPRRRQERNRLRLVEHVDRQAKVKGFPFRRNHLAFDPVISGLIFGVGIRKRVEFFDDEPAPGVLFKLVQEILDLLRVVPQKDGLGRRVLGSRGVEADLYRRIDFLQNGLRSLRQREGLLLGQIDPLLERRGDDVEARHQDEHRRHADRRVKNGFQLFLHRRFLVL